MPRTKKKTCLLVFLYIRNAISSFLYFCCMNNRIIISYFCVCSHFANGTLTWFLFLRLRRYSRLVVEKAGEALLLIWSAFSSRSHTLWISKTARCLTMKCGLLQPYKDLAHTVLLCDSTPSLSSINFCVL